MSTDENWMDALSIISDGLPSVTEGCRLPVRMQQQVIMSPPHSKILRKLNLKFKRIYYRAYYRAHCRGSKNRF